MPTIFEKIIAKEIPSQIIHETDDVIAFRDIAPKAPTHVLVIPKKAIPRVAEAKEEDVQLLGKLLLACGEVARKLGIAEDGFRVVINNGKNAGEAVPHLHLHVLGGRPLSWPPG
jgi:histidine triad (HIT) family protein